MLEERSCVVAPVLKCLLLSGLPVVNIVSSESKIQEGGNLTFVCHVTGSPTPSVRWHTEELSSNFFIQVGKSLASDPSIHPSIHPCYGLLCYCCRRSSGAPPWSLSSI